MNLLDKFIDLHPDFSAEINRLTGKSKEKFLRKLKNENQEQNFQSTISEFRFCQFIEKEGFDYEYEPKIGVKTPDFLVNSGGKFFFDVKRFNLSDFDSSIRRKLFNFCKNLKSIKKPYYLKVNLISDNLNSDLDKAFAKISNWILYENLNVGDFYIYNNELTIEVIKTNGIKDYVLYLYSGNNPTINIKKPKSDILAKLTKYKGVITNEKIPFFVAIDLTFETLKDPFDYWLQFLGGSSMDLSTGAESFQLGEFYNTNELNDLTGILIRYNSDYYWINNPRNSTVIEFKNVKLEYK